MDHIQKVLSGPVDKLSLTFWEDDDNDIEIACAILQNIVSWNKVTVRINALNPAMRQVPRA